MSPIVQDWLFRGSNRPTNLTGPEMFAAQVIAWYANDSGGHAYPSIDTLAERTCFSRRTVRRSLAALQRKGVIAVERERTIRLPTMWYFPAFRRIIEDHRPLSIKAPRRSPRRSRSLRSRPTPWT